MKIIRCIYVLPLITYQVSSVGATQLQRRDPTRANYLILPDIIIHLYIFLTISPLSRLCISSGLPQNRSYSSCRLGSCSQHHKRKQAAVSFPVLYQYLSVAPRTHSQLNVSPSPFTLVRNYTNTELSAFLRLL